MGVFRHLGGHTELFDFPTEQQRYCLLNCIDQYKFIKTVDCRYFAPWQGVDKEHD